MTLRPLCPPPLPAANESELAKLVSLITRSNLASLDKTLTAIRHAPNSFASAACGARSLAERKIDSLAEIRRAMHSHQTTGEV